MESRDLGKEFILCFGGRASGTCKVLPLLWLGSVISLLFVFFYKRKILVNFAQELCFQQNCLLVFSCSLSSFVGTSSSLWFSEERPHLCGATCLALRWTSRSLCSCPWHGQLCSLHLLLPFCAKLAISPGAAWNQFLPSSASADPALDSERLGDVNGAAEGREWGAIGLSCFPLSAWWFCLVSVPCSTSFSWHSGYLLGQWSLTWGLSILCISITWDNDLNRNCLNSWSYPRLTVLEIRILYNPQTDPETSPAFIFLFFILQCWRLNTRPRIK